MKKITQIIVVFLLFCSTTIAYAGCSATNNSTIANKIANGHSWGKHNSEYVAGKVIANLAMPSSPKVTTAGEFESHVVSVMSSTTNKTLPNNRKAYWDSSVGTIVVYDPSNNDCGTAFRPVDGKPYYERQN